MRLILKVIILLVFSVLVGSWWLLLSGSDAAPVAQRLFPINEWRSVISADDQREYPSEIRLIEVGSDVAPRFAAQAGLFSLDWRTTYGGFEIKTPSGSIFVDGGIDMETAEIMAQSPETALFNQAEYDALLSKMERARDIILTHAHRDHVMAIARHPRPAVIAESLRLNAPQKEALAKFSKSGYLPPAFESLTPFSDGSLKILAPGVLVAAAAGHTAGSQVVFVTLQNGQEFLLIGDIVWTISNISDLKIRPKLTQIFVFDPNEDRTVIKQQVRALHDLTTTEPGLTLLPAHDRDYLISLVESGQIGMGIHD